MDEIPIFDPAALAELAAVAPADRFAVLVNGMVSGGRERLLRIAELAFAMDLSSLKKEGHDLVSTAGGAGLTRLCELGRALEVAALDGDEGQVNTLVADIVKVGATSWQVFAKHYGVAAKT